MSFIIRAPARNGFLWREPTPSKKLSVHGIAGCIGRVGTVHDNALMGSTFGLFRSGLVDLRVIGWDSRQKL